MEIQSRWQLLGQIRLQRPVHRLGIYKFRRVNLEGVGAKELQAFLLARDTESSLDGR